MPVHTLDIGDLNAKTVDFLREHLAPQYEHLSDYYPNPFKENLVPA